MKNQLLNNKKVAIIGAGPVGLTTAKLLQQAGVSVTVYEWDIDENARISGGTLDIHKMTGQKALQKAGLLQAFYKLARPTGERATDISGNIIMKEFPEENHLYDRPEIDRNDLRKLLLKSLKTDTVVWNKKFVSLIETNNQFLLGFEDGMQLTADIVIGANGGKSKVQPYVTGSTPQYTGTYIIQGEVFHPETKCPNYKMLCEEDNLMLLGGEQKLLFSQIKANGAINYYVAFSASEDFLNAQGIPITANKKVASFLKNLCHNWDDRYKELFEATDHFSSLPMTRMPLDKKWNTPSNVTLVGDAAHLMPPFAGIGVNIGLLDALYLAENLTNGNFSSIPEAIADYQRQMFVYASQAQQATSEAQAGIFSDESIDDQLKGREEWNKKL